MSWNYFSKALNSWKDTINPAISCQQQGKVHLRTIEDRQNEIMEIWDKDIHGWYQRIATARSHEKRCWFYYLYRKARFLCKCELIALHNPDLVISYPMDSWAMDQFTYSHCDFPIMPCPLVECQNANFSPEILRDHYNDDDSFQFDSDSSDEDTPDDMN